MPTPLTPAERVRRLRARYGSHDKLVVALRERGTKATRQMVIAWEKGPEERGGRGISPFYAEHLAALDSSKPEDFRPLKVTQSEVARQFERIHARLDRLEKAAGFEAGGSQER